MPKKPADTLAILLGKRISELRAERKMTQEGLAWAANFGSKGYLSRIESGERLPSLAVLVRLAEELKVEVRDLFVFPDRGEIDQAMDALRRGGVPLAARVLRSRGAATRLR